MTKLLLFSLYLASMALICSSQPRPLQVVVLPGETATFACEGPLMRNGTELNTSYPRYSYSQGDTEFYIENVTYSDRGAYSCLLRGLFENYFLSLNPPYSMLIRVGSQGQSSVFTSDSLTIRCPVVGVPGPSIIYWQIGQSINSPNVTATAMDFMDEPYMDSDGSLDFSSALRSDTGHYRCTAIDEIGATVRHTFFVEVDTIPEMPLWREWYIILVYCVCGLFILTLLIIFVWFCFSVRFILWRRVKTVVKEREVVRRPKPKVTKEPLTAKGIDAYVLNAYEEDEEGEDGY